jgi:hypothetical protein
MEHPFFIFQGTMEACGFGIGRVAIIFSKNRLSSSLVRIAYPYALSEMLVAMVTPQSGLGLDDCLQLESLIICIPVISNCRITGE